VTATEANAAPRIQPFAPGSTIRRVHSEGVLLLGAGRALLMQLAHPAIAQGVAEHSAFRHDPVQRLLRTLRPTLALVYGTQAELERAAHSVNAIHGRVVGQTYDARDPDLLLWVLATLIDTTLVMHTRFIRPLEGAEAEAYYQDMLTVGEQLGVDRSRAPADLAAFRAYLGDMTATIQVSDTGRTLAREVLGGPRGLSPALWPLRQLTAGLLPDRLRAEFGLVWGRRREAALSTAAHLSRRVLPHVPTSIRATPALLLPPSYNRRR
jgi:uncharacterized protein (DUF2236 family)